MIKVALTQAAILATASPLLAADATRGAQIARQWCANCHVIGGSAPTAVQQGPPNLATVGRELTPDQLHTFLSHPHPPMPDLSLTRSEIDDLVAYIGTLR